MSTQVRERPRLDLKSLKAPSVIYALRPAEVVAAGLAIGLLVLVILYYFLALAPVQDRLTTVEKTAADQIKLIANQVPTKERGPSQKQQIQEAKDSLSSFESDSLKPMAQGRIDVINEINQLAKTDNLHLGSGIDMHALYKAGSGADTESQGSKKKKEVESLDVFPRVQFHFVVRGEYRDLRKFIRDLEANKQYIVVDSINLSTTEQKQGRGSKAAPVALTSGLSLTITMNAYFRP
jgi:hypothetical protein